MVTNKEKLLALGKKITDRIPYKLGLQKLDEDCPEYWGLVNVLDDEMVDIALSMKSGRVPMTFEEIQAACGWTDKEALEKARRGMNAMLLLTRITDLPGFTARAVRYPGEKVSATATTNG